MCQQVTRAASKFDHSYNYKLISAVDSLRPNWCSWNTTLITPVLQYLDSVWEKNMHEFPEQAWPRDALWLKFKNMEGSKVSVFWAPASKFASCFSVAWCLTLKGKTFRLVQEITLCPVWGWCASYVLCVRVLGAYNRALASKCVCDCVLSVRASFLLPKRGPGSTLYISVG